MPKTKTATLSRNAGPYVRRLLEDERVHDQLSDAAAKLRKAYRRADRKKKGGKAAEDKKLYAHLRGAATSLRGAVLALQRKPPEPRHRGRRLLAVGTLTGATVLLAKWASASTNGRSAASTPSVGPVAAGPAV